MTLFVGLAVLVSTLVTAMPSGSAVRRAEHGFRLFESFDVALRGNRVGCNVTAVGEHCVDGTNRPTLPGGFWPRGTTNQYIFNGGMSVTGIIVGADQPQFGWPGDTVGAFFFDERGDQQHSVAVTGVFDGLRALDRARWPEAARSSDPDLFHPLLLGRERVSDHDTWTRYWDMSRNLTGRSHPAGFVVDQRTLTFSTNRLQDVVFIATRIINASSRDPATYQRMAEAGYGPASIAELAVLGARFQDAAEAEFGVTIPDTGYTLRDVYVGYAQDPDVTDNAGNNFSSANFVFRTAFAYSGAFQAEPTFQFPPDIHSGAFAAAPGLVATAFLRSPVVSGSETSYLFWTNMTGGGAHPSTRGVQQLWRRQSANYLPADGTCNVPNAPTTRGFCFANQSIADTRYMMSTGGARLDPGQSVLVVAAIAFAAPVHAAVASTIGTVLPPGFPVSGSRLLAGQDIVRRIDSIAGWLSHANTDGDTLIESHEVTTVPRSLYWKLQQAKAALDNGFLVPQAPEPPPFFAMPGDNRVTIVWQRSATETTGDPYFQVASDPGSASHDPNYRQHDVEGYRIWRGTSPDDVRPVAQFDAAGTSMEDLTGAFQYRDCAPDLGLTVSCPNFPVGHLLWGDVVQVPPGGRILHNGGILLLATDTAVTGGGSGRLPLRDAGVPFVFIDSSARNGQTYYYAVTAFDVNSVASGPSTMESPVMVKAVTARAGVPNATDAALTVSILGDGDTIMVSGTERFTIDSATGRFSGTPPATAAKAITAFVVPLVSQLLPGFDLVWRLDSLRSRHVNEGGATCAAGSDVWGICVDVYSTLSQGATSTSVVAQIHIPFSSPVFGERQAVTSRLVQLDIPADSLSASRYGIPGGVLRFDAGVEATFRQTIMLSQHENAHGRRLLGSTNSPGGSRWFDGPNESVDHPTRGIRVGHLTGVDTIVGFFGHIDMDPSLPGIQRPAQTTIDGVNESIAMQCAPYAVAKYARQADIEVTWGAGGQLASVRDKTHHLAVPFTPVPGAGYGFWVDGNGNGRIDWRDFDQVQGIGTINAGLTFCAASSDATQLTAQPAIGPVSSAYNGTSGTSATFPTTGQGFGMYINGQIFVFQLAGGIAPAAGTVWTLRTYAGPVRALTNPATATPGGYIYDPQIGNPALPGMRVVFSVPDRTGERALTQADLAQVHTVPDPVYLTRLDAATGSGTVRFVNLPSRAIIRIYSASGLLVNIVSHNDPGLGSEARWNLRNRNSRLVASGVYFFHVETPEGRTRVGRFVIVNAR